MHHCTGHVCIESAGRCCRVVTCLRQWVPKLKDCGFSEVVFEDALDMLIDQLNSLGEADTLTLEALQNNIRDDTVSPPAGPEFPVI